MEKFYFKFPGIIGSFSGFYSKEALEKLCSDNIGLAGIVKSFITQEVRDAVKTLYGSDPIPLSVQTMLG